MASNPIVDVIMPHNDYTEAADVHLGMFGSLMAATKPDPTAKELLTKNWWQIIRKWYPNMHQQVYCVPPYHFNSVSFKSKEAISKRPAEVEACRYGFQIPKPSLYSTVKDDEAQQRVMWTMSTFLDHKKSPAFVLSNMEFQNYLNKEYVSGAPMPTYYKPVPKTEEGDVDVLVIDKRYGVFLLELKAIGDRDDVRSVPETEKLQLLQKKFTVITNQVEKQRTVVQKLLKSVDPNQLIKIRSGFVLANTPRVLFEKALDTCHKEAQALLTAMQVSSIEELSRCTFCADDLPACFRTQQSDQLDPALISRLDSVWKSLQDISGESKPMSDDLYEHVVALFCGPLTTVKIYTEKSMPRVRLVKTTSGKRTKEKLVVEEVRTPAGAGREVARRFSELVLQQSQIDILERDEDFVHLEGPPGTGKTLLLLLRILMWLDKGHKVSIISFFPPSRSVTHVLFEQTVRMLELFFGPTEAKERKQNLSFFILTRPLETLDANYFERRMFKFRDRAKHKVKFPTRSPPACRKVCLVVDESGMTGEGLHDFFKQVAICHRRRDFRNSEFRAGLSVWSASVERVGRPCYVAKPGQATKKQFGVLWKLKMPLRCPPTVQKTLMCVQPSMDGKNICFFKKENVLAHPAVPSAKTGEHHQFPADGLPVFLIAHGSHPKANENIWYCKECGFELARFLKNELKIGTPQSDYVMSDVPLQYKDVLIVATQNSFRYSMPIAGFMYAMKKEGLKVSVNTTRDEGSTAITDDDVILIMDMTSVHGLERAVIVVVPEVTKPDQFQTMYKTSFCGPESIPDSDPLKDVLVATEGNFSLSAAGTLCKEEDEDEDGKEDDDDDDDDDDDENSLAIDDPSHQASALADEGELGVEMADTQQERECCMEVDRDQASQSDLDDEWSERDYEDRKYTESDSDGEGQGDDSAAAGSADPHVSAALASLSEQSRKDIFYIGSRTVCQLILIHLGKGP